MKWGFGLLGAGFVAAAVGMPAAPLIAAELGPFFGAAAYVVLMGLPGVLGGMGVRFGFESARYQLARRDD